MTVYTTYNVFNNVKDILFFPLSLYTGLIYGVNARINVPTKSIIRITE